MAVAKVKGEVSAGERLKPYVPRLVIEWLRDTPDAHHRPVDGSVAFVDISGFTQLTEKLARRGKVGAEEVTDALQTIFTQLLDVAYEYDAGLLKWGGDALLLLFDGRDHAQRCCRAAAGMQTTLDRVGIVRAGGARVTLRMSVGIHSGSFDFFLVGDSHRELIITGPAATATVAMESAADAGEIAVSPVTAELVGPAYTGDRKGDAILLAGAPDVPFEPAPEIGDVSDIDLPSCIPVELRKQLLVEQGDAEHRTISVGFLQFSGTDELLAKKGPAAVADGVHTLVASVQKACERFGVTFFATDINADGGKIILVTGAPWSGGDDAERLLRAVRMIMDRPGEIPIRIGVNTGRAFTCDFGPTYRRTYQIYGDAVNLAARLMAKAEPGQVLATDDALTRSRTSFETVALEPFQVKGKSEPVLAFVVTDAQARRHRTAAAPLVGRERELQILLDAFASADAYEGRLVEIVAEPGMGKSRLIEELRALTSRTVDLVAECDEYEAATPYHAFRSSLRKLLDLDGAQGEDESQLLQTRVEARAPHLVPFVPLIGVPLGIDIPDTPETELLEDEFRKARVEEVTRELLGMLLLRPTLAVFEDTHWMDEASSDLLRALVTGLEDRPWLVITTRRDQPTGFTPRDASAVTVLTLEPLEAEHAAELVHGATEDLPLPPHQVAALAERAGGNPLFLSELVAAARAGGLGELPDTVEALMLAEIDRLPPLDRRVLRCAAVVGSAFTRELVAASLDDPPDPDIWERLAEFVAEQPGGELRFRHALVRDAAYEGLPYRRRRELHGRVAETIERHASDRGEDDAELLSLHFFHAHAFGKAWRYSVVAGDRAASIYANVEAAALLGRALDSVRHVPETPVAERARVWEALGDVTLRLSEFDRSAAAYRSARRSLDGSAIEEARLLQKEAMVPLRLGRHSTALRRLNRGWRGLEGIEGTAASAQRARLFAWCGTVRQYQRRPRESIEWCRRAIAEAEQSQANDALAQAYFILDWAYLALGAPEQGGYSHRAAEIYEELGDLDRLASVLNNLGGWAYLDGRWKEALELSERAQHALEQIGDRVSASIAAFNSTEIRADQGKVEGLELVLRDVLRVQKAAGNLFDVALTTSVLGRQLARAGRFEEAEVLLDEARALIEAEGDEVELLTTRARGVEWLVLQCESTRAVALADECLRDAERIEGVSIQVAMLHRLRGWALAQLGDVDAAREALDRGLEVATRRDENFSIRSGDYEAALALDALAQLGRIEGGSTVGLEDRRDAILERLGVVAIPKLPLPGD